MAEMTSRRARRPKLRQKLTPTDPSLRRQRAHARSERALAAYDRRITVAVLLLALAAALAATLFAAALDGASAARSPMLIAALVALGKGLGPVGAGLVGGLLVGAGVYNLDRAVQNTPASD